VLQQADHGLRARWRPEPDTDREPDAVLAPAGAGLLCAAHTCAAHTCAAHTCAAHTWALLDPDACRPAADLACS
jgi:hypothetical protein